MVTSLTYRPQRITYHDRDPAPIRHLDIHILPLTLLLRPDRQQSRPAHHGRSTLNAPAGPSKLERLPLRRGRPDVLDRRVVQRDEDRKGEEEEVGGGLECGREGEELLEDDLVEGEEEDGQEGEEKEEQWWPGRKRMTHRGETEGRSG